MNVRRHIAVLVAVLAVATAACGQTAARITPDTIALGDQATLRGHFDRVAGQGIEVLSIADDTASGERQAVVTSFTAGDHYIYLSPTDSLRLTVAEVEVDTVAAEIRDIAPLQRVPYTFWEIFRWVLLVLGIAALAVGAIWLMERLGHRRILGIASSEPRDTRPPDVRALEGLETLRREQLWQAGKAKEYHTELTDTLRRFVEESTGIRATELTSGETCDALAEGNWAADSNHWHAETAALKEEVQRLKEIFEVADMVKFAKSEPLAHEHEHAMSEAVRFVRDVWQWHTDEDSTAEAPEAEMRKEGGDA
ncbi:MAG: hypothetical protein IJU19_03350 [Bacteroidales bacterium]|nr:hypothetical protein [Bacteroidales bacterium]